MKTDSYLFSGLLELFKIAIGLMGLLGLFLTG
jgi:hypothetical protein